MGASSYNLGDNGSWRGRGDPAGRLIDTPTGSGNFLASAFVTRRGELGFSFAKPVSAVGAFMNQFQTPGATNNRLVLIAYDIDGNELESYSQGVDTAAQSRNAGSFFGIQRASADIYGFGVADGSFVMDNLTYTAPVPEPSTCALVVAGLCVIGWSVGRRTVCRSKVDIVASIAERDIGLSCAARPRQPCHAVSLVTQAQKNHGALIDEHADARQPTFTTIPHS